MKDKVMEILDKHLEELEPSSIWANGRIVRTIKSSRLKEILLLEALKRELESLDWKFSHNKKMEKFREYLYAEFHKFNYIARSIEKDGLDDYRIPVLKGKMETINSVLGKFNQICGEEE
jgi:hypothetical protein